MGNINQALSLLGVTEETPSHVIMNLSDES